MALKLEGDISYPDIINNAQVEHPTFGVGKVLLRTGTDQRSKAIIKFKDEGEKKLLLSHANLKVDKPEPVEVEGEEPASEE